MSDAKILKSCWLYDEDTLVILQKALEQAIQNQEAEEAKLRAVYPKLAQFTDFAEDSSDSTNTSSSSSKALEVAKDESGKDLDLKLLSKPGRNDNSKKRRQLLHEVNQHCANLVNTVLPLDTNDHEGSASLDIHLPSSLLHKHELVYGSLTSKCRAFVKLASDIVEPKPVVILLLQSGRFAGGIFEKGKCVHHTSFQRYTVRKGQGKAQSAQDGKRKPKSMGSQLRRAGEQQLREEVHDTLKAWSSFTQNATVIFISCPKTMMSTLFQTSGDRNAGDGLLSREDNRIRKIPINTGRPTFESVQIVYQVMHKVFIKPRLDDNILPSLVNVPSTNSLKDSHPIDEDEEPNEKDEIIEMSPLHEICKAANHTSLLDWLEKEGRDCNSAAGVDFMTPLHFAASASDESGAAAECVFTLLTKGNADPTIQDARCRPAYFLASSENVRIAFRKARAILGEDYCDWTNGGKVGPSLSDDRIHAMKLKALEKKKRKKARQKERKLKDKMVAERAAQERKQKEEEQAKQVRVQKTCDYCKKPCRGRKNVFRRLDFIYCSPGCVQDHKRELMASAALARFG